MGCQDGKWFLGRCCTVIQNIFHRLICGVIINKYSWAHLSVHYIDAAIILGNVLKIFSYYEV